MTLSDCRFYCCGNELTFSMFSNVVCRARYLDSIEMTLVGEGRVDVYAIEPAPASRWIVIRHTEGEGMVCKWFVREGETFLERNRGRLTQADQGRSVSSVPSSGTTHDLGRMRWNDGEGLDPMASCGAATAKEHGAV